MRDMQFTFSGIAETMPIFTSQLPTERIILMLHYIDQGHPITGGDGSSSRDAIRDRLEIELEIRSIEGRL